MASHQIAQLEQARKIVLADPTHYPDIVVGIIPIIGSRCAIEAQRWGADFMAETFASPIVSGSAKEKMSTEIIPVLKEWLENTEDEAVLRSTIQTAASVYPYIFRFVTNNPTAFQIWETISAIKSNILQRWDNSPIGIVVCCIKFVQRVVQVQTPGIIADPRRPEQNEISLALVPRDHPIVQLPRLEAEASGLLDRLLSVFQEATSDAIAVDATLNCTMVLVRTRQSVANKIMSNVLSFNPFKNISGPLSAKDKVRVKSMERTIRAFLLFYIRRYPQSQFLARIQQCIDRNIALRTEAEGGQSRKRGAPDAGDGLDDAKRQRLAAQVEQKPVYPPMPPPPLSLAQVFMLTNDQTGQFDAQSLPLDLVQKITVALLSRIDQSRLDGAVNAVRARILDLQRTTPTAPIAAPAPAKEEDDEYEPDYEPAETLEQVTNRLEAAPAAESKESDEMEEVALGPFKLAQPPPMPKEEAEQLARESVGRVFKMIENVGPPTKPAQAGVNRLAGTEFDDNAWISLVVRLATRTPSNLEQGTNGTAESSSTSLVPQSVAGDHIRDTLLKFIIHDFRQHLSIAISWLCEEWYNERSSKFGSAESSQPLQQEQSNYATWTERILENISPYIDKKDSKALIRFLSEIPELTSGVFKRVKAIANDPDRASLAVLALHYLVLYKPPAKEQALDAIVDLYKNYQGAQVQAEKVLVKYRPDVVEKGEPAAQDAVVKTEPSTGEDAERQTVNTAVAGEETAAGTNGSSEGQAVAAAG